MLGSLSTGIKSQLAGSYADDANAIRRTREQLTELTNKLAPLAHCFEIAGLTFNDSQMVLEILTHYFVRQSLKGDPSFVGHPRAVIVCKMDIFTDDFGPFNTNYRYRKWRGSYGTTHSGPFPFPNTPFLAILPVLSARGSFRVLVPMCLSLCFYFKIQVYHHFAAWIVLRRSTGTEDDHYFVSWSFWLSL